MKKIVATIALGALLVAGVLFSQDQPSETASELEPSILSISNHGSFF